MVMQSDVIYANLLGAKEKSIGSIAEIAWAYLLKKLVVIAMEKDNIHKHSFILSMTNVIFDNEKDALGYLKYINKK